MSPSSPIHTPEIGWAELTTAFLDEKERAGRPATRMVYARLLRRFSAPRPSRSTKSPRWTSIALRLGWVDLR